MSARTHSSPWPIGVLLIALAFTDSPAGQSPAPASAPAPDVFAGLAFRNIGPATMGGRVDDIAVVESNPAVFYVAAATGGLWKTTNNGTTWEALFDDIDDVVSIGDIAIAPDDENTVWVGTGENNNRQSGSWGNGVYKSTDAGRTWRHMGLRTSRHIARIVVDPVDHDIAYAAALGSLWGPGGDRGVYKTTDGGLTWQRVLFVDDDTGATDLVQDPRNNKVLYAATYQRRRAVWGFNGGGPGSAIWKSSDAGRTWTKLTSGLPAGPLGRIGLDIYRANPNIVYARVEHAKESGVYRSDDAGLSWRKMSSVNPRPMYFSQIRVDPTNDMRVYVLGVQLHISDDGGRTFTENGAMHSDHHAMWIDPANANHLVDGNDGGVGVSYDKGRTWEGVYNIDIGQFYHVGVDMQVPYMVCGGLQDNYTWCGPSQVRGRRGIANDQWFTIQGGDGFEALIDPGNPRIIYAESQDGNISKIDAKTNERQSIRPVPARGEAPYRWNWNTPIVVSPHNPSTIYVGANRVFKSTDRGHSWTAISPDLTANTDRETLALMGVTAKEFAIAKHDGVGSFGNLVQLAESPLREGLIYAGADDGTVHVTRNGGASWENLTGKFPGRPKDAYVSGLAPSRHDADTVYVTFDNHANDDYGVYVYGSVDGGGTWRSLSEGIPEGHVTITVTEDPKNPAVLYAGTEFGLYVSVDRGGRWMRLRAGLPTVPIHEVVIHPRDNDMVVATHGRSIWILDDVTPLQQLADARRAEAFLFDVRPARQYGSANDRGFVTDKPFFGKNPTPGAPISYYLAREAKTVSLRIGGADGQTIRTIDGDAVKDARKPGINRVHWDLRHQPLPAPAGQPQGGGFFAAANNGPLVLPGDYRVTLTVDDREVGTKTVRVAGDPDIEIADADRREWHDTALALHGLQKTANEAADALRQAGEQFQALERLLRASSGAPADAKAAVEALGKQLTEVRRSFGLAAPGQPAPAAGFGGFGSQQNVRARIGQTKAQVMAATARPTEQQTRIANELKEDLEKAVQAVREVAAALPGLYDRIGAAAFKPAAVKIGGDVR